MVPPAPHSSVPRVPDQTAGDAWDGTPRRARTGHGGLGCVSASAVYLHPMTLGPLLDTWATGHPEPRLSRTARAVVPLSAHRHQRPNSISPVPRSATPTFCAGSERATCCPESIQSGMRVMIKAPTSTVKGPVSRARPRLTDEVTAQPTVAPPSRERVTERDCVTAPLRRLVTIGQPSLSAGIVSLHGASRPP